MGPRTGLEGRNISSPPGFDPGPSSPHSVAIPTELPGPLRDIVRMIKIGRLWWLGHLFRIQELDPCRKLILLKPEGTRSVRKRKLRRLGSVEEDLN